MNSYTQWTLQADSFELMLFKLWRLIHPLKKLHPLLREQEEAVARLEGEKAAAYSNISVEPLKARGEAEACGLHAVFTTI